jgi:hypothetical protein
MIYLLRLHLKGLLVCRLSRMRADGMQGSLLLYMSGFIERFGVS